MTGTTGPFKPAPSSTDGLPEIRMVPEAKTRQELSMIASLLEISTMISGEAGPDISGSIPQILEKISVSLSSDRCCLFRYSDHGGLMNLMWEYSHPSLLPLASRISGLYRGTLGVLEKELQTQGIARFDFTSSTPGMSLTEEKFYATNRIRSLIACPMHFGSPKGGVILVSRYRGGIWTPAETRWLRITASVLSETLSRKQAEKLLHDTQENLDSLMEHIDDLLFILDPVGRILHANAAALRCVGYDLPELRKRLFADLVPPIRGSEAHKWLAGGGRARTSFFPLVGKDGHQTPVESRLSETRFFGQKVLLVVGRDITARMQALAGLKKYQSQSMAIINALPDLILRMRKDGAILDTWNSPTGPTISRGDEILPRRLASALKPLIGDVLQSAEIRIVESRLPDDRKMRVFECRIVPFDEDEVLALARDISEKKMIEQMKSEFIDQISHDLRTPLTTARLMVDLIREGGPDVEIQEYWQILDLELNHQNDLIGDLLTISRLEKGRIDLNCHRLNPSHLLHDSVKSLIPLAEERKIYLHCDFNLHNREISGDPGALRRVVINLIENAIKFSTPPGDVRIQAEEDTEYLIIRFQDHGMGISKEDLPRIFDRFYRSRKAVDIGANGCGVGLYLVKAIVEAHHGTIFVESRLGEGTTFSLRLPLLETVNAHKT